ncbi:23S rRNA (guanosine(2251)-2'-O)-methyltransferase RlmB [Leuconostoc mesenteroides]|jgi:23S rRNA (guanosine2251-2'-O)-methyltransferase|uniref:RNA methyltransferase, TrmH family, group 3 n=1 Tax=Leuconostoc mesenteroides subsp. cremoris ATCC 19254 TaxID=586220 RepID=C2KLU1_LEUMC|nr:23S rRNA (guanosine(2251)-2'-O)-methyltransferase RlmB [Leuconostoc mesenteroides]EQC83742.1 rRNA methyltransferase [Leuconostoc mesenteroides subsp. cremoris TIFN8]KDA52407.1 tRNA/rRNA methyltransferase [Leuconostoc mesenteroides subsp. cremoris T26]AKP35917.1 RNA methyltransferase [Leuconostoc mesenteroides subsp. dextranicum]ARR89229.1 23S rRNA (guanosine(2251)-2'-O)-methyltransferase RlmB [Leuconostoc mesenteroides subsp. mesenteroides]EEJ41793.1 RNA methyltransferase, TrmH family, grou
MKPTEPTEFVYGHHASVESLKSTQEINKVWLQTGLQDKIRNEITQLAKKKKLVIQQAPKSKLDELTDGGNHQGVVLSVAAFEYASIDDLFEQADKKGEAPFFVILDGIEDPHNLGSILRTADAAGVHGIIIPKRRAVQLTATVAKTSTGAIEHVPVARVTNLVNIVEELKKRNVWVFGTDMAGDDYRRWDANGAVALIIGNEGRGISPLLKKKVDGMVTIPMVGHVQSLNASVAASLLIYQGYNSRNPL